MERFAVIGAGFGDEGKGKVVSYLCQRPGSRLVYRFCGGHQAAHRVVLDNGRHHVFSNFGSGTLQGVPTFWSKHCTIDPVGIMNELTDLVSKGTEPRLTIHQDCPVTTPFDKIYNVSSSQYTRNGSCGVGFGATLQREQDFHSILAEDLVHQIPLKIKVDLLKKYYRDIPSEHAINEFMRACRSMISSPYIEIVRSEIFLGWETIIFEGSQGLLLDQNIGFFPHVTRANTGITNIPCKDVPVYLVTRAYQTRHGNGPMTNEGMHDHIYNHAYEQNNDHGHQGAFRISMLDIDLLKYAVDKSGIHKHLITLCVTCIDLMKQFLFTDKGSVVSCKNETEFVNYICHALQIKRALISRTPTPEMEEIKIT